MALERNPLFQSKQPLSRGICYEWGEKPDVFEMWHEMESQKPLLPTRTRSRVSTQFSFEARMNIITTQDFKGKYFKAQVINKKINRIALEEIPFTAEQIESAIQELRFLRSSIYPEWVDVPTVTVSVDKTRHTGKV